MAKKKKKKKSLLGQGVQKVAQETKKKAPAKSSEKKDFDITEAIEKATKEVTTTVKKATQEEKKTIEKKKSEKKQSSVSSLFDSGLKKAAEAAQKVGTEAKKVSEKKDDTQPAKVTFDIKKTVSKAVEKTAEEAKKKAEESASKQESEKKTAAEKKQAAEKATRDLAVRITKELTPKESKEQKEVTESRRKAQLNQKKTAREEAKETARHAVEEKKQRREQLKEDAKRIKSAQEKKAKLQNGMTDNDLALAENLSRMNQDVTGKAYENLEKHGSKAAGVKKGFASRAQKAEEKAAKQNPFLYNFMRGTMKGTTGVDVKKARERVLKKATGKKTDTEKADKTIAGKAGNIAGNIAGYMMTGGAMENAVAESVGKKMIAKRAAREGEKIAKLSRRAKGVSWLAGETLPAVPSNLANAVDESNGKGTDRLKSIAKNFAENEAMDVGGSLGLRGLGKGVGRLAGKTKIAKAEKALNAELKSSRKELAEAVVQAGKAETKAEKEAAEAVVKEAKAKVESVKGQLEELQPAKVELQTREKAENSPVERSLDEERTSEGKIINRAENGEKTPEEGYEVTYKGEDGKLKTETVDSKQDAVRLASKHGDTAEIKPAGLLPEESLIGGKRIKAAEEPTMEKGSVPRTSSDDTGRTSLGKRVPQASVDITYRQSEISDITKNDRASNDATPEEIDAYTQVKDRRTVKEEAEHVDHARSVVDSVTGQDNANRARLNKARKEFAETGDEDALWRAAKEMIDNKIVDVDYDSGIGYEADKLLKHIPYSENTASQIKGITGNEREIKNDFGIRYDRSGTGHLHDAYLELAEMYPGTLDPNASADDMIFELRKFADMKGDRYLYGKSLPDEEKQDAIEELFYAIRNSVYAKQGRKGEVMSADELKYRRDEIYAMEESGEISGEEAYQELKRLDDVEAGKEQRESYDYHDEFGEPIQHEETPAPRSVEEPSKKSTEDLRQAISDKEADFADDEYISKATRQQAGEKATLSEETKKELKSAVYADVLTQRRQSQSEAIDAAAKRFEADPEAVIKRMDDFNSTSTATADDIADMLVVTKHYESLGEWDKAADIFSKASICLTNNGRGAAAGKMFLKASPTGRVAAVTRLAEKLAEERNVKDGIKISEESLQKLRDAESEIDIEKAQQEIRHEIWEQIPVTWAEKVNAWRYMSMLMNPKTHVRNILGNAMFVGPREAKNAIGTWMEEMAAKKGYIDAADVTKSVKRATKEQKDAANEAWLVNKDRIMGNSNRWSDGARPDDMAIYKSKALEKARRFSRESLEKEDEIFLGQAFREQFTRTMNARGLTKADLADQKTLEEVTAIAELEAKKATYRNDNDFAEALKRLKTIKKNDNFPMKVGRTLAEGVIPFAKTPTNILARGIDYSPVGMAKGIAGLTKAVKAGDSKSVIKAIDDLSAGLTGTGVLALGYGLGQAGILQGAIADDEEGWFRKNHGEQSYSVNVGDVSITIDWAVPISLPLLVGAQAANGKMAPGQFLDSLTRMADPVTELSMLSGFSNTLDAVARAKEGNTLANAGMSMLQSYGGQFIPTMAGQVARTIDPTRRTTQSTKDTPLEKAMDKFIKQQKNKLPFLSQYSQPYINEWGETEQNTGGSNVALRILSNFFSPAYVKKKELNSVDKEILRLCDKIDEPKDAIPSNYTNPEISYNGQKIKLSESAITVASRNRGKVSLELSEELISSPAYQKMSDEEKAKALGSVYNKATKWGKMRAIISEKDKNGNRKYNALDVVANTYKNQQGEPDKGVMNYKKLGGKADKSFFDAIKEMKTHGASDQITKAMAIEGAGASIKLHKAYGTNKRGENDDKSPMDCAKHYFKNGGSMEEYRDLKKVKDSVPKMTSGGSGKADFRALASELLQHGAPKRAYYAFDIRQDNLQKAINAAAVGLTAKELKQIKDSVGDGRKDADLEAAIANSGLSDKKKAAAWGIFYNRWNGHKAPFGTLNYTEKDIKVKDPIKTKVQGKEVVKPKTFHTKTVREPVEIEFQNGRTMNLQKLSAKERDHILANAKGVRSIRYGNVVREDKLKNALQLVATNTKKAVEDSEDKTELEAGKSSSSKGRTYRRYRRWRRRSGRSGRSGGSGGSASLGSIEEPKVQQVSTSTSTKNAQYYKGPNEGLVNANLTSFKNKKRFTDAQIRSIMRTMLKTAQK